MCKKKNDKKENTETEANDENGNAEIPEIVLNTWALMRKRLDDDKSPPPAPPGLLGGK